MSDSVSISDEFGVLDKISNDHKFLLEENRELKSKVLCLESLCKGYAQFVEGLSE